MLSSALLFIALALMSWLWLAKSRKRGAVKDKTLAHLPYPPGPPSLPVVGSVPFLKRDLFETLLDLKERYGKIFAFDVGSSPVVMVADYDLYAELSARDEFAARPGKDCHHVIKIDMFSILLT